MRPFEQWIWLDPALYPDRQTTIYSMAGHKEQGNYTAADFRRSYAFPSPVQKLTLRFSGDTVFRLYCCGTPVASGPASVGGDFHENSVMRPQHYSTTVVLYPERNTVELEARVRMMPVRLNEYSHGHGGFQLWGEARLADGSVQYLRTDSSWFCRLCGAFAEPGFYDGRIPPEDWHPAAVVPNLWHTEDSPLPPMEEREIFPAGGGEIRLMPGEKTECTLEFDRIYAAYPKVEIEAAGENTLTLHCFEHKEGGSAESFVFAGNDTVISSAMHSVGGYRVSAENRSDAPSVIRLSLIASSYPVKAEAFTVTDDEDLNRVLDVCRHTLRICRQTIHLDSPRHCEPLACTGDYYIETLMTAYAFGDMTLAAFDIRRTAELLRYHDGIMFHTTYSLIWVKMLWDVYCMTGEKELLTDCTEALHLLLRRFSGYLGDTGLIETPRDFMFVDWIYIDGISLHHPPKALGQTVLNAYYYEALRTAAKIYRETDESVMAERCLRDAENIKTAVNTLLFDPERQLYFEGLNTPTPETLIGQYMPQNTDKRYYLPHSNILCCCFGLCEGETARQILRRVVSDELQGGYQPYFAHFLLEAVYRCGLRDELTLTILEKWKQPVRECPKGLVEGFIVPEPTYSFDHSHAWGGTPLYSLPKALLGLEILTPGYRAISLSPSLLGLTEAQAEVPTPFGILRVRMQKNSPPEIDVPNGIRVTLR